jgi:hypothetical protein
MAAQGSVMGFVAKEQFAHFTDDEVAALYQYLSQDWTAEKAAAEEKKIPIYFPQFQEKGSAAK